MILLADRFVRVRDEWYDIATARRVRLVVRRAGLRREQLAWADRCAALARLRHPLLNALVDYGAAGADSVFEAYVAGEPLAADPATAAGLHAHAARFLASQAIAVTGEAALLIFRRVQVRAGGGRVRPLGVLLQPREAGEALADLLSARLGGGTTAIRVAGPAGSGLRTLETSAARLARLAGFVPVSGAALARWPMLFDELACRHVCLLDRLEGTEATGAAAALLARLAVRSARPHIYATFTRARHPDRASVHLEPMGITTMTSMLFQDPELGPPSADVARAARRAQGLPGRFLAALGAGRDAFAAAAMTAREATVPYTPGAAAPVLPVRARPGRGAPLARAAARADALQQRGRHAAAARLLERAARVLAGRGDAAAAAGCHRQLAWMARDRGATARALAHAEAARRADPGAASQVAAALVAAVCWTDEARLLEAEASLRSLVIAAAAIRADALRAACLAAHARVAHRSGRFADAIEAARPLLESGDAQVAAYAGVITARATLGTGDLASALRLARDAVRRARCGLGPRVRLAAHRAMAEALLAAGETEAAQEELRAGVGLAAAAHLPLWTIRLRILQLQTAADGDPEAVRLAGALRRASRGPLPLLIRGDVERACGPRGTTPPPGRTGPPAALERFLHLAHGAPDDPGAAAAVLDALLDELRAAAAAVAARDGRVLAAAGRPWRDRTPIASRALAAGDCVVTTDRQPGEAGCPVRCGDEMLAALAVRWLPGAAIDPAVAAAVLRAASLSIATHVRGMLDDRAADPPQGAWSDLLGDSPAADALRQSVARAARAPFPVLIEGESGSGKELVARAIHRLSPRHARRFCALNCAALSDELIEAELFGHVRGAFTGAATDRAGLFEEADGGTLFLDEIGELSARAQAKLLRVLQEGEVRRVGENLPRRVDVRIVAATNRHLEQEAAAGRFRTDLRFRLDVLRIAVPPLRERAADLPVLARHFWQQACVRLDSRAVLGPDALAALSRHGWPGNVRELQNVVAWMAVHAPRRGRVGAAHLPAHLTAVPESGTTFEAARDDFERRYVRAALANAGGRRQAAAAALGISRQGLAKMMRRLRMEGC